MKNQTKRLKFLVGVGFVLFLTALAQAQTPGTLKWSYPAGGYSSATLSADGSTIYVGSTDDKLYALNTDGTLKWSYTTGGQVETKPCVAPDGTIYIGSTDQKLYAINPGGTLKWTYQDTVPSSPIYGSCTLGADGTIYFGSDSFFIYAINPDGTVKWKDAANAGFTFSAPYIGPDGTIYIHQDGAQVFAITPAGTVKWADYTFTEYSSPTVGSDGTIYCGTQYPGVNGQIGTAALNPDGSVKWTHGGLDSIHDSPAIGPDGTIYVGHESGGLEALNGSDGSQKWYFGTGYIEASSPTVATTGVTYIGDQSGIVYAVNSSGSQLWTYTTGAAIYSTPAIGNDGTIYVQSTDGHFYAIYGSSTALPASAPSITTQPASQTVAAGCPVTFTVVAGGGTVAMSYQWQFNGNNISGATGSTYMIPSVAAFNAGNYTVVVRNASGSTTSATAVLTVPIAVSVSATSYPPNLSKTYRNTISFTLTASSPPAQNMLVTFLVGGNGTVFNTGDPCLAYYPTDFTVSGCNQAPFPDGFYVHLPAGQTSITFYVTAAGSGCDCESGYQTLLVTVPNPGAGAGYLPSCSGAQATGYIYP